MRKIPSKRAGWPKSKPVHSPENRIGQAWKPGSVQVIGKDCFGNTKVFDIPAGHFQCRYCLHTQKIVRVDTRGFAACESCGMIYNDGNLEGKKPSNRELKRRIEKHKYDCCHKG